MKVLIIGDGISGKSAYNFLISKGYEVEFAKEDDINSGNKFSKEKYDRLFQGLSFALVSPGISLDNHLVVELMRRKIKVIGELELGANAISGDIIAITGTNGKTTTASLINFILSASDRNVFLGGNIGTAVTSFASQTTCEDINVLECSSYQLETVRKFHPHIAGILNITPDHLTRHKSMKNYIKAKYNITKNQTQDDFLLLNADSDMIMQNLPKTKAKILFFSTKQKVVGCYIKNDCIYFNDNQKEKKLVSLSNIKLIGEHNLSNILCAVLAVYLETGKVSYLSRIIDFQGVPHRIEFVKNIGGIAFYNDSKATNIDSTLVAVRSFKANINLILGGSEKGYEFDELFKALPPNVKNIAVFGQTKAKIYSASQRCGYENIYKCNTLKECVNLCYKLAKSKDIVLLSPACASFDHFKNYEERGNVFKKIVKEIASSEDSLFGTKKET